MGPFLALAAAITWLLALTGASQAQQPAAFAPASLPQGTASSTLTGCLWVGENYGAPNAEGDMFIVWSGTVTSAKLVGDEFNVGARNDIYLNLHPQPRRDQGMGHRPGVAAAGHEPGAADFGPARQRPAR